MTGGDADDGATTATAITVTRPTRTNRVLERRKPI
jgi:hypothetical protein